MYSIFGWRAEMEFLSCFTSACPPLNCCPCFCDSGSPDHKTWCSRTTANSHVDLWNEVFHRHAGDSTLDHSVKGDPSLIRLLRHLQINNSGNKGMLTWACAVSRGADFICKTTAKQIIEFCIPPNLSSSFLFPRWRTIETNLLRSFVPSQEYMS